MVYFISHKVLQIHPKKGNGDVLIKGDKFQLCEMNEP